MWIRFPYCLKLCTLDGRPSRLPCCYVFPTSSRISNCGSTGTSNPEPNSSSPTMTYTHNLLPTIIETESQIPTRVLIQTLIPMVHRGVKSYRCIIMTRAGVWEALLPVSICVCVCGLTSAHILPGQQHGHLGDIHPFLNCSPAFHPLPSSIPHSHQRQGRWRLWRLLGDTRSL